MLFAIPHLGAFVHEVGLNVVDKLVDVFNELLCPLQAAHPGHDMYVVLDSRDPGLRHRLEHLEKANTEG